MFSPKTSYVFFKDVILKFMKSNNVIAIKTRRVESPWENFISRMKSKAPSWDYISKGFKSVPQYVLKETNVGKLSVILHITFLHSVEIAIDKRNYFPR